MRLALFILLLSPGLAFAGDVDLFRQDGDWRMTREFQADDDSPEAAYRLLESVCETIAQAGDKVVLNVPAQGGKHDQLDLAKVAHFVANAPLTMTKHHDNKIYDDGTTPAGPSVVLGPNKIVIEGTLCQRTWNNREDGALVGYSRLSPTGEVEFRNATLDGSKDCDYVVYHWINAHKAKVTLIDSKVLFARHGIALEANNGVYEVLCKNVEFIGDANGSQSWASTSKYSIDCVLGNVVRGKGTWHVEDCTSKLTGLPENYGVSVGPLGKFGVHRLAAFGNQYDSTSKANPGLVFTAKNVSFAVASTGNAKEVYDADFRYGVKWSIDNAQREAAATEESAKLIAAAKGGSGQGGVITVSGK
jgi:hypothetical protein